MTIWRGDLATLIDTLDKFGMLTGFVSHLAAEDDAAPELTQLHRIMIRAGAAHYP